MFELMKIVGVSAVLSAGLVTASDMQPQAAAEPTTGKIYSDRVAEGEPASVSRAAYAPGLGGEEQGSLMLREGKGDAFGKARQDECASQSWPHVAPQCMGAPDGSVRGSVRMITVEQREGANTSVLVRVPAAIPTRH